MDKDIKFYKGDVHVNVYSHDEDHQLFFSALIKEGDKFVEQEVGPIISRDTWASTFETETTKYFHTH
tara:strand:- start:1087 stop:1287 length:201 start_codon:yes stop_codon:yes gene_type:complete